MFFELIKYTIHMSEKKNSLHSEIIRACLL